MLIPTKLLRAAMTNASRDPTRYVLSGVLVERLTGNRARLVATDGHRLIKLTWEDKSDAKPGHLCILDLKGLENALTAFKQVEANYSRKERDQLRLELPEDCAINGHAELRPCLLEQKPLRVPSAPLSVATVGGRYPDYRRVSPDTKRTTKQACPALAINPNYLAEACTTLAKLHALSISPVRMDVPEDPCLPVTLRGPSGDEFETECMIMPCRL